MVMQLRQEIHTSFCSTLPTSVWNISREFAGQGVSECEANIEIMRAALTLSGEFYHRWNHDDYPWLLVQLEDTPSNDSAWQNSARQIHRNCKQLSGGYVQLYVRGLWGSLWEFGVGVSDLLGLSVNCVRNGRCNMYV